MPRRSKGARLYLRRHRQRAAVWVILDHGREISTGAGQGDIGAAEEALANHIGQKHRPDFGEGDPSLVLIADALAEYGEKHAPTTRRPDLIGGAIGKLIDFFGPRAAAAVTSASCNEYVQWRVRQPDARALQDGKRIKPSTARRELVVLGAALRWCWKEGKIDRPIPVWLPSQPAPRERHLTRTEAAALLAGALGWDGRGVRHSAKINRHLARFILIALYTGTRHDAILRLQWVPNTAGGWIDLASGVIYRRATGSVDSIKRRPPVPHTSSPVAASATVAWAHAAICCGIRRTPHPVAGAARLAHSAGTCRAGRRRNSPRPTAHLRNDAPATWCLGV